MSNQKSFLYENILKKKLLIYKKAVRALSLQRQALDIRDVEKVFLYSEYLNDVSCDIRSVDSIPALDEDNIPEELFQLTEKVSSLKRVIRELQDGNISLIKEAMSEIDRQILSVKLLNKRNSLYNPVSRSEHIDITR